MKYLIFLFAFLFSLNAYAECTGCGEEGHELCLEGADHSHDTIQEHEHIEGAWLDHKHVEEGAMSTPPEVVFAVCVFSDGTLIDHKGADSMSDCLKTKRLVEKKWKNKAADVNTIEINGIEYHIDGESLQFMCDLVDAQVHHYEDGTWEIINILGKHKKDE
jgi:hypothetical protein